MEEDNGSAVFSEAEIESLVEKHYNEIVGRDDAYMGKMSNYNNEYVVQLYYHRDDVDFKENPYASVNIDSGYVVVNPVTGIVTEEDGDTWSLHDELQMVEIFYSISKGDSERSISLPSPLLHI